MIWIMKNIQTNIAKAEEIMRERDIDETYIRAMNCHAYGICTDTKPESKMEMVLYATDELTGLINALCLMRPSKSVLDLELKSLKKNSRINPLLPA